MESSGTNRRFPAPWRAKHVADHCFEVHDANGLRLAIVEFRSGLQQWSFASSLLSEDEARRIAAAISRLPELLMPRRGFYPRNSGPRWKPGRPYHVAINETYMRTNWDWMDAMCKHNSIPFNTTGEVIEDGGHWRVYEFERQLDAMQFWDAFEGRWLRGSEFHYPERTVDFPRMKPLKGWPKFDPRKARG